MCRIDDEIGAPSGLYNERVQVEQALETSCLEKNGKGGEDMTENEEDDGMLDQLFNRGHCLRQLRLLALADDAERIAYMNEPDSQYSNQISALEGGEEKKEDDDVIPSLTLAKTELEDVIDVIPSNGVKILRYESFLAHQRYYDDMKHIDMNYIDFGNIRNSAGEDCGSLVLEQRKSLGKGGFYWDAGFVLGEHIIANEKEWNTKAATTMVELGSGTGLSGLMIAKATKCLVTITDLPEFEGLMRSNVQRNFTSDCEMEVNDRCGVNSDIFPIATCGTGGKGMVTSKVLRWGIDEDYSAPYDVVVGADIVASLYDPIALANTLHALSGPNTIVYVAGKTRLDKPHQDFEGELNRLFRSVKKVHHPISRLSNPNIFIIVAEGKITC